MRHSSIPTIGTTRPTARVRRYVEPQAPDARYGTRKYQEDSERLMGWLCAPLVFGLAYVVTTLALLVL